MGLTLNGGYGGGGSGSYHTIEVTITNGTAASVTATLGSTVVNLTYDSGVWRGTLKAFGTWTVEASNGEKTVSDTVDVTNVAVYTTSLQFSPLPSGYTELEYIESTGTQYIDTGLNLTSENVEMSMKANFFNGNSGIDYFGCMSSSADANYWILYDHSSYTTGPLFAAGSTNTNRFIGNYRDAFHQYTFKTTSAKVMTVTIDETQTLNASFSGSFLNVTHGNVCLFRAGGYSNRKAKCAFGLFELKQNGVLVRSLYPARRDSDSVLGMYDTVTDTFYTNAGTGSFVAGPEV